MCAQLTGPSMQFTPGGAGEAAVIQPRGTLSLFPGSLNSHTSECRVISLWLLPDIPVFALQLSWVLSKH